MNIDRLIQEAIDVGATPHDVFGMAGFSFKPVRELTTDEIERFATLCARAGYEAGRVGGKMVFYTDQRGRIRGVHDRRVPAFMKPHIVVEEDE